MALFLLMRTNVDSASGRLHLLSLERLPEREKVDSALASCGKSPASRLKSAKWRGTFSRTEKTSANSLMRPSVSLNWLMTLPSIVAAPDGLKSENILNRPQKSYKSRS